VLKLRLFAKTTSSNTTINPHTGEEEQHRATVLLKSDYLAQCQEDCGKDDDQNDKKDQKNDKKIKIESQNTISDPNLDVDFVAQCRSRDAVCLFCHLPLTPLLLSKTPVKPATYQLLTLLVKLNSHKKTSPTHLSIRKEMYNLINTTFQHAKLTKKALSTYLETNFIYNANLDIYTIPQDGIDFAQTIENTAAITCKKCISNNDEQRHYSDSRILNVKLSPELYTTYLSLPLILPYKADMSITTSPPTTTPLPSSSDEQIEPIEIQLKSGELIELKPSDEFHEKSIDTVCTITPLDYKHSSFSSLRQLNNHTYHSHGLEICTACHGVSHDFLIERELFNRKEMVIHAKQNQHSFCNLCHHQCYDNDELYAHLVDPINQHYMCRFCTQDNIVQQNDLSQFGQIQAKKQSFKFFRNKASYILHMYHDHFVCDHPQCKQFDPYDSKNLSMSDPSRVQYPHKMVTFSNQFDLQQHQNSTHNKQKSNNSKKIDLTAMFTSTTRMTSSPNLSNQPGYLRATGVGTGLHSRDVLPVLKDENGKIIKNTLDIEDILIYSRVVQLSSDTQTASALQQAHIRVNNNVDEFGNPVSNNSQNQQNNSQNQQNQQNNQTRGEKLNITSVEQYQELFPSLSGSSTNTNQANSVYSRHSGQQNTPKQDLFPALGGKGSISTQKNAQNQPKQDAFPSFGSSKATASTSKVDNTPKNPGNTNVGANIGPVQNKNVKKNTLIDFINWNRAGEDGKNAPKTQLLKQNLVKKNPSNRYYFDYENNNTDGDILTEVGYHYEPTGSSKSSFAAAMGNNYNFKEKNVENDKKNISGDKNVDFPTLLGDGGNNQNNAINFGGKSLAQKIDSKSKNKNKKGTGSAAPVANAWGLNGVVIDQGSYTKKVNTNSNPFAPAPIVKKDTKNVAKNEQQTKNVPKNDQKNANKNTGLVANSLQLNSSDGQNGVSAERKLYDDTCVSFMKNITSLSTQINTIMTSATNKGNKKAQIEQLLWDKNDCGEKSDKNKITIFEEICNHVGGIDVPRIIPNFTNFELISAIINDILTPILSLQHRKLLGLLLQQISLLLQSLLVQSDDDESSTQTSSSISLENFEKTQKLFNLNQNTITSQPTQLKLISASIQQLNKLYPTSNIHILPQLLQYPLIESFQIVSAKFNSNLCNVLQYQPIASSSPSSSSSSSSSSIISISNLNKTFVPIINDNMTLSKRLLLYQYLFYYVKNYVFKSGNIYKLVNYYLRSLDAQEGGM
jgi:hypothetical protein